MVTDHKRYMTRTNPAISSWHGKAGAQSIIELWMKLLTSIAIIMQSENCKVLNEPSRSRTQLQLDRAQTVDNFEKYNYVINIFVLIENKCNNKEIRRWLERHAGGGRETMIQFVVA